MASTSRLAALALAACLAGPGVLAADGAAAPRPAVAPGVAETTAPGAGEPTAMEPPAAQPTTAPQAPPQQTQTQPQQTQPQPQQTQPQQGTTAPVPTVPAQTTGDVPVQPTGENLTPDLTPVPATRSISPLLWVLIGLVAIALIGLIAWLVHWSSRRSDRAAVWHSRRLSAYAEGAALHDAIMSAQEQRGNLGPNDEMIRWNDIQRRADNFSQRLYQLRDMAPDEDGAARAENVLASLQGLRNAVDAERSSGVPGGMTADMVSSRLANFRVALHTLRGDH